MTGIRIATKDGEDVRCKSDEISEELLGGLIVGLGKDYEATLEDYAEGFYKAFAVVLESASPEGAQTARDRLIQLLQGANA